MYLIFNYSLKTTGCYGTFINHYTFPTLNYTNVPLPSPSNKTTPSTCLKTCLQLDPPSLYFLVNPLYAQYTPSAVFTLTNFYYSTSTLTDNNGVSLIPTSTSVETTTRAVFAAPTFTLQGFTCGCLRDLWDSIDADKADDTLCKTASCQDGSLCGGTDLVGVTYALYMAKDENSLSLGNSETTSDAATAAASTTASSSLNTPAAIAGITVGVVVVFLMAVVSVLALMIRRGLLMGVSRNIVVVATSPSDHFMTATKEEQRKLVHQDA